ncbi:MAG: hypothetical protein NTZ33_12795 [Bacteroidetes bacterium]|nr:hypothetical protein [Bacteroidota bacterium]
MSRRKQIRQNTPLRPDENPDATRIRPGVIEPEKNDPTRIIEPPNQQPEQ